MTPHPPANYGRLAKSYKFWEYLVFGRQLRRCREAWWKALLNTQEALILGDGDGRFSTFLLENHPTVKITSLDVSLPMLNQAEKRREKRNIQENRVTTILSDVNSWDYGNKKFDAVVTHFFMDSFETLEMKTIATTIKNVLKPGRQLHISDFHIPKDPKFGRWRARLTLGFLYPIFRVITNLRTRSLVDYKSILISHKTFWSPKFTSMKANLNEKCQTGIARGNRCISIHLRPNPSLPIEWLRPIYLRVEI